MIWIFHLQCCKKYSKGARIDGEMVSQWTGGSEWRISVRVLRRTLMGLDSLVYVHLVLRGTWE